MIVKSCFNCKYLTTWDYAGTLEDPPDSGWDCNNKHATEFDFIGEEEGGLEEQEVASFYADRCTEWKYCEGKNEEYQDYLTELSPITHAVKVFYGSGSYTTGGADTGEYPTAELRIEEVKGELILEDKLEDNYLFLGSQAACDRYYEENYLSYSA